jgi:ATP-binding cassette subfamily B protein
VPQRPFLFADTVRANLRLDRDLSDSEIWHWLDAAGVREDIERLPRALDTRLGEWGVNLSGGQKQRLTLARGLAARPRVLLLDDCLSAVDTVTEERILAALDRELRGTTLVWVAHRRSTLKHCSQILELERQRDGLLSREAQS